MEKFRYSEIKGTEKLKNLTRWVYSLDSYEKVEPLEMNEEEAKEFVGNYYTPASMPLVPYNFRNSKDFMKWVISERYPLTYSSAFMYASDGLKNDPEMATFAVEQHGAYATHHIGERLLANKSFIMGLAANEKVGEYAVELLAERMQKEAPGLLDDVEVSKQLVTKCPNAYRYLGKTKENTEVVFSTIESVMKNGASRSLIDQLPKTLDERKRGDLLYGALLGVCKKAGELPKSATARKNIYAKLADALITKIKSKSEEVENKAKR